MVEESPQIDRLEAALSQRITRAGVWEAECEQLAAELALAMAEAETPHEEMVRRLRAHGLSKSGTGRLIANARRIIDDRVAAAEDEQLADAVPVCPHCLHPIEPLTHFCPQCNGPVSAHASMDPLGQVYSAGRFYRQAVSGRPGRLTAVIIWLIFGPSLIWQLYAMYLALKVLGVFGPQDQLSYVISDGLAADLLKLLLLCGLISLHVAILWKVTSRALRKSPPQA